MNKSSRMNNSCARPVRPRRAVDHRDPDVRALLHLQDAEADAEENAEPDDAGERRDQRLVRVERLDHHGDTDRGRGAPLWAPTGGTDARADGKPIEARSRR